MAGQNIIGGMAITTSSSGATTASIDVWPFWNANVTAISNVSTNTSVTWPAWNVQFTTGTSGVTTNVVGSTIFVNDRIWTGLNNRYTDLSELKQQIGNVAHYSRRKLSEDELKAELEREKQYREAAEKRVLEAKLAQERAERLLRMCLSKEQIEDLDKKNCFYIKVNNRYGTEEIYRIDRGSHGNVKQIDEKGSIIRSFCIQPNGVPIADSMLAQKLFIESDEETRSKFWETANITHLKKEKEIPIHIPRAQRREHAAAHGLLH